MITDDELDRLTARALQHRLDLIRHTWTSIPTDPALERLFRAVARELSQEDLETFCTIPATIHRATSGPTTPVEIPHDPSAYPPARCHRPPPRGTGRRPEHAPDPRPARHRESELSTAGRAVLDAEYWTFPSVERITVRARSHVTLKTHPARVLVLDQNMLVRRVLRVSPS